MYARDINITSDNGKADQLIFRRLHHEVYANLGGTTAYGLYLNPEYGQPLTSAHLALPFSQAPPSHHGVTYSRISFLH